MKNQAINKTVSNWVCGMCAAVLLSAPVLTMAQLQNASESTDPVYARKYERATLHVQNIDVRALLQQWADFSQTNLVLSDDVKGTITLQLTEVAWDDVLALVLRAQGLGSRRAGNTVWIAPAAELSAQTAKERVLQQQEQSMQPVRTEVLSLQYARAENIANILIPLNTDALPVHLSVDARTNTLLLQGTTESVASLKRLVAQLDKPVRQVMIEARIVKANDDMEQALGIKFGTSTNDDNTSSWKVSERRETASADRFNVHLPRALTGETWGAFGLTIGHLPGGLLVDMELSALESEGLGEIVFTPRLLTSDQQRAFIESGEEIPYHEATATGASAVTFKKAVLRLEVLPQITPDDCIILDLKVNQDARGPESRGSTAIDKQELQTQVLVRDGETIVLGGVYKHRRGQEVTKVPFLGDLPLIGFLFRNKHILNQRDELLIILTPHILRDGEFDPKSVKLQVSPNLLSEKL